MIEDLLDTWRDNMVLRIIVVIVIWAIAAIAAWFFDFWGQMAAWNMPWLVWATLAGFIIAGLSLVLSPWLEQFT